MREPDGRGARRARGARAAGAAIRFRVRQGVVGWDDLSATGSRSTPPTSAATSSSSAADGTPLYHFTVVVDDAAMRISHVIRGEDHVSNTPKHILLFEALGYPLPGFAHLPLILNPDGTKMSKRKSQTAVADYIAQGFIKEALVNYFAFLGWSPGTEEDVLSARRDHRAVRHREGPEGRRPVRPRAARVAERPVDPAPR